MEDRKRLEAERRKRLAPPNQSADAKYYASNNPSALADGPGLAPAAETRGGQRARVPARTPTAVKALVSSGKTAQSASVKITKREGIQEAMQHVVALLQRGAPHVLVAVPAGNVDLMRRTRAAVEMLVTRELITEDQGRGVRLAYVGSAPAGDPPVTKSAPLPEALGKPEVAEDPFAFTQETPAGKAVAPTGAVEINDTDDFLMETSLPAPMDAMPGAGEAPTHLGTFGGARITKPANSMPGAGDDD